MKLYHFCAMRQSNTAGSLNYTDGVITTGADLSDSEQYRAIKALISDQLEQKGEGPDGLVLLSLTLIGEAEPAAEYRGEYAPHEAVV